MRQSLLSPLKLRQKKTQLILHNGSLQKWELFQVNGWPTKQPFLGKATDSTQEAVDFSVTALDLLVLVYVRLLLFTVNLVPYII